MIKKKTQKQRDEPAKMLSSSQVLIEHFDAKFDLLFDGHIALHKKIDDSIGALRKEMNERFDDVYDRFDAIDEKFDAIDMKFEAIDNRFAAIDLRFEAINDRFTVIDDKFEVVFEVLDDIKREVKSVKI